MTLTSAFKILDPGSPCSLARLSQRDTEGLPEGQWDAILCQESMPQIFRGALRPLPSALPCKFNTLGFFASHCFLVLGVIGHSQAKNFSEIFTVQ